MARGLLPAELMQVSFNSKIRYKGQEYESIDEVPSEIRAPLDKALARVCSDPHAMPGLKSRIVINGRAFSSSAELPPEYRRLIDDSLRALLPIDKAIGVAAAQEYSYAMRGAAGLATLLLAVIALALFCWQQGMFR